jgi:hypothetical protein
MKLGRALLLGVLAWHIGAISGASRPNAVRTGSAIVCLHGAERVLLRSTDRLPEASGVVTAERRGGTTEVDVEVGSMKPASLFGGDYNTYVLWIVPPQGPAENLGEILLYGDQGKLHATTSAETFTALVTAEPHYLVNTPSPFVVLQNKSTNAPEIRYAVLEGVYNFERSTLADRKRAKGMVHTDVRQAFTAVRLAQRAGAPGLASEEFLRAENAAEQALDKTLLLWHQGADHNEIAAQARETVRLAVAAQRLATDRGLQGPRMGTEGSVGGTEESGGRDRQGR